MRSKFHLREVNFFNSEYYKTDTITNFILRNVTFKSHWYAIFVVIVHYLTNITCSEMKNKMSFPKLNPKSKENCLCLWLSVYSSDWLICYLGDRLYIIYADTFHLRIFICISAIYGLLRQSVLRDQLRLGFIAQLVGLWAGIAEVMGSNPKFSEIISGFNFTAV